MSVTNGERGARTQTPTDTRRGESPMRCDDANQVSALINSLLFPRLRPRVRALSRRVVTLHEPFNIWRIPRVTLKRRRRRRRRRAPAGPASFSPFLPPPKQNSSHLTALLLHPTNSLCRAGSGRDRGAACHTFISRCPLAPEHFGRTDRRTEWGQLPQSTSTPNTHTN